MLSLPRRGGGPSRTAPGCRDGRGKGSRQSRQPPPLPYSPAAPRTDGAFLLRLQATALVVNRHGVHRGIPKLLIEAVRQPVTGGLEPLTVSRVFALVFLLILRLAPLEFVLHEVGYLCQNNN